LKFVSEDTADRVVISYVILPSTKTSSTPVTVTVCGMLHLAGTKVAGETTPSLVSELTMPTVTLADGWHVKTRVNSAVPPDSVV
jgi:hypothetical protein